MGGGIGRPAKMLIGAAYVLILIFAIFPLYWMLITSLRPASDTFTFPPEFLPTTFTFEHYEAFFKNPAMLVYLRNSILVAVPTAIGSVVVSAYAAYSFSKFEYRGRRSLMSLILSAQMFPQALLLIALYVMFDSLGLLNTYVGLMLSFVTITLPLSIYLLKAYFDQIPDEIIEAATVDGASHRMIIHRVLFPIARPGLTAVALFAFVRAWNDFIFALTLVDSGHRTLPPGLVFSYMGEFQAAWPEMMAASVLVSLPIVVLFVLMQSQLVAGLTAGAVKG